MPDTQNTAADSPESPDSPEAREQRQLAHETKNERYAWWFLAYFLFGIHIVAFVMIYGVTHAN
jgi:nitrate reductase NapE component